MVRKLTSASTLENLGREARRWLKALRRGDARAIADLERTHPAPPDRPRLRDVQHALARGYGFDGWSALRRAVRAIESSRSGDERDHAIRELFIAAQQGDVERVGALLDAHPDIVNANVALSPEAGHRTALHHAGGHAAVVRALLERGADPNLRDEGDRAMPLHFAAERGDLAIVRLLVEHGADPIGADDWHALEVIGWATCFAPLHRDVAGYLLAHGARHTILSAVAMGDTAAIRTRVAEDPACLGIAMEPPNQGRTPLHLAVIKRRPDSLRVLLELGADLEARDRAGLTALDQAALAGDTEAADILLGHGADVRLPAAVGLGRTDDIERILHQDPDALKPGNAFATLLIQAAQRSSARVIRMLLDAGADVNVRADPDSAVDGVADYTAMHAAAFHGNADAVEVLLERGADPNIRDGTYCGAPAGWAAHAGHDAIRDRILQARIDPFQAVEFDRADRIPAIVQQSPWLLNRRFGEYAKCRPRSDAWWPEPWHTPLVRAVLENRVDAVRALLRNGAAQVPSPDGRTLVHLATEAGFDDVARLLREYESPASSPDARIRWFVKNACPDHDIRSRPSHAIARHTAERLLRDHPELATASFETAVICGEVDRVARDLAATPGLADRRGGPKEWTPLLYLCFTRLPGVSASVENAVVIARMLLDAGADPNAHFMAGDSTYTPLVGAVGEGEEDRPAHVRRDELVSLLLERGAQCYDSQVLYNIHFRGDALWFLERIHASAVRSGRSADWDDPEWPMLDMGGYGSGARYVLEMAIRRNEVALARWALEHGANPDAAPPRDPRFPEVSLHQLAVGRGRMEIADLLVRHGATVGNGTRDDEAAFVQACLRLDRERALELLERHPELLRSTTALFAAVEQDRPDAVAFVLDLGVPLEVENDSRQRALHVAAWSDAVRAGRLLIERGAAIDPVETEWNNTPIDYAVYHGNERMSTLLGSHSRDIGNLTYTGRIARLRELLGEDPHIARRAAERGQRLLLWLPDDEAIAAETVRLLLEHGVDPAVRDANGLTAADHAERRGLREAARLLREAKPP